MKLGREFFTSLKLEKVGRISKNLSSNFTRSICGSSHRSEKVIVRVLSGITVGSILG